ncbi:MAG: DUF541 domain-containing protein [Actinobacteria bacterium]|nr:DUF541 domain-containing protein [Actinomycetota bacterium]
MRKNRKIIAIALALVSILSVGALGIAPAQANEPSRHITVTGVGSVSVVPDAVRFYPSVTALAAKSADALATASRTASAVRSALRAEGIAAKDIKSSNLSVFPEYNYTQDKGSVIVGYRATQSFNVVIRKADTAGKVVESVVNAGNENVQINGIVPFVTKGSAAMEEARAAAVADARARAASYAKLLGSSLGKVVYLQENSAPSYNFPMLGVAKAADGATPEIDLGEEELSVSITVRWALN